MQSANVRVSVGGPFYTQWERIHVRASIKEAAREFNGCVAAELGSATATIFKLFTPVVIYEGDDLLFTGYVDERAPSVRANPAKAGIEVGGRSKAQDAIDCSCVHETGSFENMTLLEIAKALDKFGIGFTSDTQLDPIPYYQIQPGASLYREIERLCRDQGVTLAGQPDGSVKLTKAGANPPRQAQPLTEAVMEHGSAHFRAQNRHSIIYVRGQSPTGNGADNLQIEATATDSTVPRYRPTVILPDGATDKTRAATRAANYRDQAAGEGIRARIATGGWRDSTGALWLPGNKVWTESDFLGLAQDMLIETVEYEKDDHGSMTYLDLVDPRAHGGKSGKGSQSDGQWNMDSTAATDN